MRTKKRMKKGKKGSKELRKVEVQPQIKGEGEGKEIRRRRVRKRCMRRIIEKKNKK